MWSGTLRIKENAGCFSRTVQYNTTTSEYSTVPSCTTLSFRPRLSLTPSCCACARIVMLTSPAGHPNPGASSFHPSRCVSNNDSTHTRLAFGIWQRATSSSYSTHAMQCSAVSRARLTTVQIWPRSMHVSMTTSERALGFKSKPKRGWVLPAPADGIGQDTFGSDEAAAELIR